MAVVGREKEQVADKGSKPASLDIASLSRAILRRWKLVASVAMLLFGAIAAITMLLPPKWTAEAQIRLEPTDRAARTFENKIDVVPPDQAMIDTEVGLMLSRENARAVVEQLDLTRDPAFHSPKASAAQAVEEATLRVQKATTVGRIGETYLVSLAYTAADPATAAKIANALAQQYIAGGVASRVKEAIGESESLDRQLSEYSREVQGADARLAAYRASRGLVQDGTGTVTDQQISPIASQLADAEARQALAQSKLRAAQAQLSGGVDGIPSESSAVLTSLRNKRADLQRQRDDISARFGPQHPELIALDEQIRGADAQIRGEVSRIMSGLTAEAQAASASAGSIRGELQQLRGRQAGETRASVEAQRLEREATARRTVYSRVAEAAQQSSQRGQDPSALARIVTPAETPLQPSFPNRPLFVILGALIGALAGVAAAIVLEMMDSRMWSSEEVEAQLGIPFIASVPLLSRRKMAAEIGTENVWDYIAQKPMSAPAEALRNIRASLIPEDATRPKVIAICSALPSEGKSSLAASLGRIMALSGDRTLLIDCDLRRNALKTLVPEGTTTGLVEVLEGNAKVEDVIVKDGATSLSILPLADRAFTPSDLFRTKQMHLTLLQLSMRFDTIILDTPPLLAVADARALAALADAIVMTVRWNSTPRFAARTAISRLGKNQSKVAGAVLTMTQARAGSISPTDPAYYSRKYAGYYEN